jgi:hypothetical protein
MDSILSRSKTFGHQNIELLRTLFSCGFTLPDSINFGDTSTQNSLHTLFEATWETLQQFSKTKEIQAGMIAVLHTWGQH